MSWRSTRAAGKAAQDSHQVAVVDLGSNSWRLVVFTYAPGAWWKLTDELYETVRIGAGLAASGRLSDEAMARGLETLSVFGRFCRANGLSGDDVHVVATSAIRDAANGEQFLADAEAATGLTVETLSAEDEARFGYVAAVNTTTLRDGVVLDIGGGSLQLTEVHDRKAGASASFPIGAVRMTEQFLPGPGPAKKKEIARLRTHVREQLSSLDWLTAAGHRVCWCDRPKFLAGTAHAVARIAHSSPKPASHGSGRSMKCAGENRTYAALTSIVFSVLCACVVFGRFTVSTPCLKLASILSASTIPTNVSRIACDNIFDSSPICC